jgi:hypothetical protein
MIEVGKPTTQYTAALTSQPTEIGEVYFACRAGVYSSKAAIAFNYSLERDW